MRRWAMGSVILLTAACSGGNSPVQDLGTTLTPKSEAFASGTLLGIIPIVSVVVTDLDNVCGLVPTETPCSISTSSSSATGFPILSATLLEIGGLATGPGTYDILVSDGGGASLGGAEVTFEHIVNGEDAGVDQAVSGKVNFSSLKQGDSASGSYDVVMQSGAHLSGNFSANDCPALDALFTFTQGAECSSSGFTGSCSGECTCEGKTVQATCTAPDAGAWQCTCTSSTGEVTTCTTSSSVGYSSACQAGSSCCPYSF